MTKDQANEVKVGIVVLVCLALGLAVAMQLSDWEAWVEPKKTLTFKVPYQAGIGGIKAGWPVAIGGVQVGSVEKTWLKCQEIDPLDTPEEPLSEQADGTAAKDEQPCLEKMDNHQGMRTYSYFRFTVPSKYKLREDCELTPVSQLIGGAGELVITDLGTGLLLKDGQEVFRKSLGGSSIADVMDTVQTVMDKAKAAVDTVQVVLDKAKLAVDNVHTITEDFKDVSSKARDTINLSKPQLEKTIANVRAASEEMKQGMREIRWNPWRLLHNPTDRELRTQNLLTSARTFSSGASDLDAAAGRLEGLIAARQGQIAADDPELAKIIEQLQATMAKFSQAEKAFFKRLGKGK